MPRRLALGTVQFGLPYGIANSEGQVSRAETTAILNRAWEAGVDTLDTAAAYGESERCLGEIGVAGWRIVSKLPVALPEVGERVAEWVQVSTESALRRLNVTRLAGLLLHRADQLLGPNGEKLAAALREVRASGLVEKVGVSVYSPEDLALLWPRLVPDLVQAPFSVVDRRLLSSGWLARLHAAGVEVHVRSVFLQGLLLMPAASRPARFDRWNGVWRRWEKWLQAESLSPVQACLAFARSHPEIHRIVVGVQSVPQLEEILMAAHPAVVVPPDELSCDDRDLVDPSRWAAA